MRKLFLLLSLFAAPVFAGPYYGVTTSTTAGTALMNLSGKFCIAVSSVSSTTCITYFNDPISGTSITGPLQFRTATDGVGVNIIESADGTAHMAIGGTGPFDDFKLLTVGTTRSVSTSTVKNIHEFAQSSTLKVTVSSGGINMLDNSALTFTDGTNMTSTAPFLSTTTAAATYVKKAGDTMTGPLTLSGSSLTVSGSMTVDTASNTLVVDSTRHRIGILKTSPNYTVEIATGAGTTYALGFTGTDVNTSHYIDFGKGFDSWRSRIEGYYQSGISGGQLHFWTASGGSATIARRLSIIENGNVGIGTTSPAAKLHVVGDVIVSTAASYGSGGATWEAGGGRGVYATNNSGAAMSSGTVVQAFQSLTGLTVTTSAINSDYPVGTVYDDSCANGSLCRVCTEGICPARLITTGACAITNVYVKAGGEVGRAECATISAGTAHNDEIGQPATFSASNGDVIKIWAHRN